MTKRIVKIGLIQTKVSESLQGNITKTAKLVEEALKKGANVVCLQELYNAPYFPQYAKFDAEKYLEDLQGPSFQALSPLAKKYNAVIIVPIFERFKKNRNYNTALVINTDGKPLKPYRKMHIPHDPGFYEKYYFAEGEDDGYQVYKTKYGVIAVLICFDQWFPEAARAVSLKGADMIFYPTAIGYLKGFQVNKDQGDWHDAWELTQRSHAIDNSVVVAAANRVGTEGKLEFWGQSFVSGPFGKIMARASKSKDEALVVEVDLALNKYVADGWGFRDNRRPKSYQSLIVEKKKRTSKLRDSEYFKESQKLLGEK
ncbi:MAG TPA: carbon-nitrogen hydrolase [Patescibacteria group bacterium]|nr:carbon-nitrogen hydrolase [Patescibacteria group bacterium]